MTSTYSVARAGEVERPGARPGQFAQEPVRRAGAGADGRDEDVGIKDDLKHE